MPDVERDLEEAVTELLGKLLGMVFRQVDWRHVARGRSKLDVFQHRLLVAGYQPDFDRAFEKLCSGLSLQAPHIDIQLLEELRRHSSLALKVWREKSRLLTYLAWKNASQAKAMKEEGGEGGCPSSSTSSS